MWVNRFLPFVYTRPSQCTYTCVHKYFSLLDKSKMRPHCWHDTSCLTWFCNSRKFCFPRLFMTQELTSIISYRTEYQNAYLMVCLVWNDSWWSEFKRVQVDSTYALNTLEGFKICRIYDLLVIKVSGNDLKYRVKYGTHGVWLTTGCSQLTFQFSRGDYPFLMIASNSKPGI